MPGKSAVTGYLIGSPLAIVNNTEASFNYWFGTVRFIHFVSAFVFFFNFLFRLYWGFSGNEFSRWYNFIPLKRCQWKEIMNVIKVDVLQTTHKEIDSIGHNSLASLVYWVRVLYPKYAKDFPQYLSAHEIGLKDLIDAAFLLGNVPEICLLAISVKSVQEMGMHLSPEIQEAVGVAAEKVKELVKSFSD